MTRPPMGEIGISGVAPCRNEDMATNINQNVQQEPTVTRELFLVGPAFVALLVFLAFMATSVKLASAPEMSTAVGSLAALVLGLVINPRPGRNAKEDWNSAQAVVWVLLTIGAFAVAVLSAIEVFHSAHHVAGTALTASVAAFGGLFLDASKITHTTSVPSS